MTDDDAPKLARDVTHAQVGFMTDPTQSHDLERLERYATHARNDAISIVGAALVLRTRPPFETRAEEALRIAEGELETALDAIRRAMREYNLKPITA